MKTVQKFRKEIDKILKNYTPQEIFRDIRPLNLSRTQLMILDSAIKKMPMEHIPETLLLRHEVFYSMLQNLTLALKTLPKRPKNTN